MISRRKVSDRKQNKYLRERNKIAQISLNTHVFTTQISKMWPRNLPRLFYLPATFYSLTSYFNPSDSSQFRNIPLVVLIPPSAPWLFVLSSLPWVQLPDIYQGLPQSTSLTLHYCLLNISSYWHRKLGVLLRLITSPFSITS